jgi:hypothetical protein
VLRTARRHDRLDANCGGESVRCILLPPRGHSPAQKPLWRTNFDGGIEIGASRAGPTVGLFQLEGRPGDAHARNGPDARFNPQ